MKTAWKIGLAAVVFAAGIGWVVGAAGSEPADLPEVGNPVQVSENVNSGRAGDDESEAPRKKNRPSGNSSDDDGDNRSGRGGGDDDVEVVTPRPDDVDDVDDVDDDADDGGDERDDRDDD